MIGDVSPPLVLTSSPTPFCRASRPARAAAGHSGRSRKMFRNSATSPRADFTAGFVASNSEGRRPLINTTSNSTKIHQADRKRRITQPTRRQERTNFVTTKNTSPKCFTRNPFRNRCLLDSRPNVQSSLIA